MRQNIRPTFYCVLACIAVLTAAPAAASNNRNSEQAARAGVTPAETLSIYFEVLKRRDKNPALPIYTPATQKMLEGWPMTAPQMENVVHTYSRCNAERAQIDNSRRYAVIRYPIDQRQCSPWFFNSVGGAWALDLTMMQHTIRFGGANAWRFELSVEHPYRFAFSDWSFDSHGFPRAQ